MGDETGSTVHHGATYSRVPLHATCMCRQGGETRIGGREGKRGSSRQKYLDTGYSEAEGNGSRQQQLFRTHEREREVREGKESAEEKHLLNKI
jgi:hypothetical protein